jgi:hypothetical protein
MTNPGVCSYYQHFLTPGHVLTALYEGLTDARAEISAIIRQLVVSNFEEQRFTRLEQAGSSNDNRPGIHRLFIDLPFISTPQGIVGMGASFLARTIAQNHNINDDIPDSPSWTKWKLSPSRARIWFVKGGPGQGKSTLSQYLCQIQRAALILNPGGPVVNHAIKIVVQEVRERAVQSQLWPLSPRIPVSVELKDFAQWLGRKSEDEACGILTYLAERIGNQLEQPVLTGTLKRAFGMGRWMFVFDGLDEVPSDVKERVADEVVNFIDDVLVGCNADAFHICTSRPQGYSGQFGRLDACGVELQSLSADQALACAQPVLQFDRTVEDFNTSVETLRAALQSPSIKEIMTTPLQAHIMAVVVRDGGKPPERKWQLFANFYQVIKKRETNRKLPDKNLSKLLLNGDKLLKAVHNRLGFELHKRAETSEGAQTSLKKAEFRKIVQSIVERLQDSDIEETVSTLMEATTDRLVLVNTPDNGNEVRFDIRPLQEFFAGEYIYESVDAHRLGERMKIIGGDAHWREVTHFLLSALVENDRLTELFVATEVLSEVDELEDVPSERAFRRRMALGGAIASRLLAEGVLEHDKRVRQHFRRCLEPLFATMSSQFVSVLCSTAGRHSMGWLHDVLIDHLMEQSEAENFVAAASLLRTLPDSHSRVDEVLQYFRKSSLAFRSTVFRVALPHPYIDELQLPKWAYVATLEAVLDPHWMRLGVAGIRSAFSIIGGAEQEILREAAGRLNLGTGPTNLLATGFVTDRRLGRQNENVIFKERFGALTIDHVRPAEDIGLDTWAESVWTELEAASGMLHMLYLIFNLARTKSVHDVHQLVAYLGDQGDVLRVLPPLIHAYLPLSRWDERDPVSDLVSLADGDVAHVFPTHFGCLEQLSLTSEVCTTVDWCKAADKMPSIVLSLLGEPKISHAQTETARAPEVIASLIEKCIELPGAILSYPGVWEQLIAICPELEEQLRQALVIGASRAGGTFIGSLRPWYSHEEYVPMQLRLPSEATLLAQSLIAIIDQASRVRRYSRGESGNSVSVADLTVKLCHAAPLYEVAFSASHDANCRAAAAMLYMLHPDAKANIVAKCERLLVSLYVPNARHWYLKAAAATLDEQTHPEETRMASVLGQLLVAGRSDFEGRYALEPTLERWRERSSAPVLKSPIEMWS